MELINLLIEANPFNCLLSIFDSDESKIVSAEGLDVLADEKQMTKVQKAIDNQKSHGEIYVDL